MHRADQKLLASTGASTHEQLPFIYALDDHRLGNKGHCVLLPTPDELCSRHVGRGWMNHSETFKDDSFVVAQSVAKIVSRGVV